MQKLVFSAYLRSAPAKLWDILWKDDTYRQWTSVFSEGSYAVSDWKEGSAIHFLSPNGDGMYSLIEKMIPNELMSFRHLGMLRDGKEQPQDELTKKWSGSRETYILSEKDGGTELVVEIDVTDDMQQYFQEKFPKALEKVKELAEAHSS